MWPRAGACGFFLSLCERKHPDAILDRAVCFWLCLREHCARDGLKAAVNPAGEGSQAPGGDYRDIS